MISLRGVAVHNLKNIDLDLPLGKLILFCGRSGSGKSSLALDTIYAEGERRYIETFSPAMRQFLEKIEKPKADVLDGIPPAIAVTSGKLGGITAGLTVGDQTEIADYLALLFAQTGSVFCPKCSRKITADTPQTIFDTLKQLIETKIKINTTKINIAFAPPLEKDAAAFAAVWKEQGFLRGISSGTPLRLDEPIPPNLYNANLLLIADRLTFDPNDPGEEEDRFIESLESALNYGNGKCTVFTENETFLFSQQLSCEYCGVHIPPLTTKLFDTEWKETIHLFDDVHSPVLDDLLLQTAAELIPFFDTINRTQKCQWNHPCPSEEGELFPSMEGVESGCTAKTADSFCHDSVKESVKEIQNRLRFLQQVGLGHLTLNRPLAELSGGEQRRVALTSVLGSSLVDMLYVLDEPSLGLHPSEVEPLLEAMLQLRDRGNTVIAVEHNEQILRRGDYIVELGPGAGESGGEIVFHGTVDEFLRDPKSLTAKYLTKYLKYPKM